MAWEGGWVGEVPKKFMQGKIEFKKCHAQRVAQKKVPHTEKISLQGKC